LLNTCARRTTINETDFLHLRRAVADPLPHPDAAALLAAGNQALQWMVYHFLTLPDQEIGHTLSRLQAEALLREPPPEMGRDFLEVLEEFAEKVVPNAFRINSPRFLAFVPSAPVFPSILGDLLCAGTNFFAGVWLEASGPAEVELVVLDWFKDFVGYPAMAGGLLTSGGSEATLTALLVARERLSFEERQRAVLYVTEQRHWSVDRAAKIIGLRPDQLHPLPADAEFRLQPDGLVHAVKHDRAARRFPWALVANAGATNTGAIDPLPGLSAVCRDERLWLHVDAAYGWAAVLTTDGRRALEGIALADSLTLDPHKWFGQTFEAGCVLVREGKRLSETFAIRPEYMQDVEPAEDEVNFADQGIALTRRFRALKIWVSVKVLGVAWFRALAEHGCRLAEFAEALLLRSPGFEIMSPQQLSIVCFRYVPVGFEARTDEDDRRLDRLNLQLIEDLRATRQAFISSTRLQQRVALRFCFVNWRTTAADVEMVVELLTKAACALAATCR
jgi:glutamate/tyrosine decarboxylase-like PLP-dependent enzyme